MVEAIELFTDAFATAWQREINADPDWSRNGPAWSGAMVFRIREGNGAPGRALFLDLEAGECLAAREASGDDLDEAPWVFGAPIDVWRGVVAGEIDPIAGLLHGRLRLERGDLMTLAPYARSAKALFGTAARLVGGPNGESIPMPRNPSTAAPVWRPPRLVDNSLFPARLWQSAKKAGAWNPSDLRLDRDRDDWSHMEPRERDIIRRLGEMFLEVKQRVLPVFSLLATFPLREGRVEEGVYLTSLLSEEGRHLETFSRFLAEVAIEPGTDSRGADFGRFLDQEIGSMPGSLAGNAPPEQQARAWVTCNLMIEGVIAHTGYRAFHEIIERLGIMPGMQRAIQHVKHDESRHLAFGAWVLARLGAQHGDTVSAAIRSRIDELAAPAHGVMDDVLGSSPALPFGFTRQRFAEGAATQFRHRVAILEKLQALPLERLLRTSPVD